MLRDRAEDLGIGMPAVVYQRAQPRGQPTGARAEILDAALRLVELSPDGTSTAPQLLGELGVRGTRYSDPTFSAMLNQHMCAVVSSSGVPILPDVIRVRRGVYRLSDHWSHVRSGRAADARKRRPQATARSAARRLNAGEARAATQPLRTQPLTDATHDKAHRSASRPARCT